MVTGGSVVALKYKGGVMVAADTLASYGSLARYEGVSRIAKVGISNDTMLAAGGDYSDYQMILKMIEQKAVADFAADDGSSLSPKAMHHWLTRVMYNRRSKMDPLWNAVIITGFRDGKAYLGSSDLYGTMFEDDYVATGLGGHLALPLIRKAWHAEMSEEEARKLLVDCMRVLFYRDTRFLGTGVFWSRGNGWALGALVAGLQYGASADPHYGVYLRLFNELAAKLARLQP